MATVNINTTLKATPKLSPSILENYVTEEELAGKNYVTDVTGDGVYVRKRGDWIPETLTKLYKHTAEFTYSFFSDEQIARVIYISTDANAATDWRDFRQKLAEALAMNDKPQLRVSPSDTYTAMGFFSTDAEYGFYYGNNGTDGKLGKQLVTFKQELVAKI